MHVSSATAISLHPTEYAVILPPKPCFSPLFSGLTMSGACQCVSPQASRPHRDCCVVLFRSFICSC